MKNMIIVLIVMCSPLATAMEREVNSLRTDFKTENVIISVILGSLYERPEQDRAPITVTEVFEQEQWKPSSLCISPYVTKVFPPYESKVYVKDENSKYGKAIEWSLPNKIACVVAPGICKVQSYDNSYKYRYNPYIYIESENRYRGPEYEGEEAFIEAQNHLGECYVNILNYALKNFGSTDKKIIALPEVGAMTSYSKKNKYDSNGDPCGFSFRGLPNDVAAKIAVTSLMNFFKNPAHKDKFEGIQIVTKDKKYYDECHKELSLYYTTNK